MNHFLLYLGFLFPFYLFAESLQVPMQGSSIILMNAESGAILFEKEAHVLRYPASTTKVATALYALKMKEDALDLPFIAQQEALGTKTHEMKKKLNYQGPAYRLEPDGSHIGIKLGEEMSLRDLLGGLLIASGNDAANVIAQGVSLTIPQFMEGLNQQVQSLGCSNTTFYNPHGLHHPAHQTTAYDLALITQEALKYPAFRQIISQARYHRPKTNKQTATVLLQTNRLIRAGKFYYPKAIGVKTGYHAKAKHTLIAAAHSGDRTLIAVLLDYQEREMMFAEAIKLFEVAFNQPKIQRQFVKAGPQPFTQNLPNADQPLKTYLAEPLVLAYYPAEDPQVKCYLHWQPLTLPITKDQLVGELHLVSAKGETLKTLPLLAVEEVKLQWLYQQLKKVSIIWLIIGGGVGISTWLLYRRVR
jgi:serine-type D-Ala-D-Ala carboxypeptidase (penicillin-binding protein 5/6)